MLRAVIFDLDGVLIDSEPLMRLAFADSYRRVIGNGSPPIEAYLEHMGESFPRIMDRLNLPHSLWEPYREFCQEHIAQISLFPGSRELLEWARSERLKVGLLTGKDRARTAQILEHFELQDFFDVTIASDQLNQPKPHPEGVLKMLEGLGSTSAQSVMIGDAVNDIICAQEAGVKAIAITWGTKPERVQRLCRPDYIAHDWNALQQILEELLTTSA
jgi:3-amino-5-hydroxybenzoic acid synthesis related protein